MTDDLTAPRATADDAPAAPSAPVADNAPATDTDAAAVTDTASPAAEEADFDPNAFADSLLGALGEAAAVQTSSLSVIEQIADAAVSRYERLPMLEVILDRVVRHFTERLMQLTSSSADASLHGLESGRFGDMTSRISLPCLVAVVSAPDWAGECLIALDQRMIYDLVETLLGGERPGLAAKDARPQLRAPTAIERRLTQRVFDTFADTLETSFSTLKKSRFTIDRVETTPHFAMIARENAPAVGVLIGLEVAGAHGEMHLIIPYNTLEPVRPQLRQMFMGEKLGRDEGWDARLRAQVAGAPMRVTAQIDAGRAQLSDVMAWRPGDIIPLPDGGRQPAAALRCQGRTLGAGAVGAKNGRLAVRLASAPEAVSAAPAARNAAAARPMEAADDTR